MITNSEGFLDQDLAPEINQEEDNFLSQLTESEIYKLITDIIAQGDIISNQKLLHLYIERDGKYEVVDERFLPSKLYFGDVLGTELNFTEVTDIDIRLKCAEEIINSPEKYNAYKYYINCNNVYNLVTHNSFQELVVSIKTYSEDKNLSLKSVRDIIRDQKKCLIFSDELPKFSDTPSYIELADLLRIMYFRKSELYDLSFYSFYRKLQRERLKSFLEKIRNGSSI